MLAERSKISKHVRHGVADYLYKGVENAGESVADYLYKGGVGYWPGRDFLSRLILGFRFSVAVLGIPEI